MRSSRAALAVAGSGRLYEAVWRELEPDYQLIPLGDEALPGDSGQTSALLCLHDRWMPEREAALNRSCREQGLPWLRAALVLGQGLIGPWVRADAPGCLACAEARMLAAREDAPAFAALRDRLAAQPRPQAPNWDTGAALLTMARLVAAETAAALEGLPPRFTHRQILRIELGSLRSRCHPLLPDPACPVCGSRPDDSAERAEIRLRSRIKIDPATQRIRRLAEDSERLARQYVDPFCGLIRSVARDTSNLYANVVAPIGLLGGRETDHGFGHLLDFRASQAAAIAEALERYAATRPGRRTTVRGSYRDLADQALDPACLGLHDEQRYADPDFGFARYDPDQSCTWVWAYALGQRRPVLVPEHYAYYALPASALGQPFVYETSNGCAMGSCVEEAILSGVQELAERDAFLMTWYARLRVPQIDLRSVPDPTFALMLERARRLTGYSIEAFNITLQHALPCAWMIAVDHQERPGQPRLVCAAGAHPNPAQALRSALHELMPSLVQLRQSYPANQARARALFEQPELVARMSDHALLYGLPEAAERLDFLRGSPRLADFAQTFGPWLERPPQPDIRDDLLELLAWYADQGLEVLVVDQTAREHEPAGLRCVKVIVPGLLPMTFGHQHRRLRNLDRLLQVPCALGYTDQPLRWDQINPDPHPFP
jgi:ribosomal protein S12 methylthiotransferase accessory factor